MRILYSHYLPHEDQPAGYMIHAIARELRQLGHDVLVHASAGDGTAAGATPRETPKRLSWLRSRLWFAKAIYRDLARRRRDAEVLERCAPDVLLVRQDPYCISMTSAGSRLGIPVVTYADAPAAYEARQRNHHNRWHPPGLVEALEVSGLKRSRAVISVSRPAAQVLKDYGLSVPIHVVPNGIDPGNFPELSDEERLAERKRLGLTAPLIVTFQGTFQSFHGIDRVRDLMLTTAGRSDTQWLLIGDGPEKEALEKVVAGRVPAVFLGRQPHERMGRLLALADVAVAPYTQVPGVFYGCPLKVLEYAAAGCAVLASDQGDIPLLLGGGHAGLVLPTEHAAWSRELHALLGDSVRRECLRKQAREWARSRFTWKWTAERIDNILKVAAGARRIEPERRSAAAAHDCILPVITAGPRAVDDAVHFTRSDPTRSPVIRSDSDSMHRLSRKP